MRFASITPTTTSIVCSLNRSSFRNCATGISWPSTKSVSKPCRSAQRATSVWKPLRAFTSGASTLSTPRFAARFDLLHDRGEALLFDRQIAVGAELRAGLCEEQAQEMINFRHRRDGRFPAAARDALLDRDARRHAFDEIDVRLLELLDELPRIRRHAVEESALPFGKENVERDGRFPRAAQAGDDHHLVARNRERDVLQVVLARAVDLDRVTSHAVRCRNAAASSAAIASSSSSSST